MKPLVSVLLTVLYLVALGVTAQAVDIPEKTWVLLPLLLPGWRLLRIKLQTGDMVGWLEARISLLRPDHARASEGHRLRRLDMGFVAAGLLDGALI
jgi:hypothetical protein